MQTKMTALRVPGAMIMKSIFPFNARVPYGHMTRVSPDREKPAIADGLSRRKNGAIRLSFLACDKSHSAAAQEAA